MTSSTAFSTPREPIGFRERFTQLLYSFILLLAFTTLYAMAETRSLESRTIQYLPPQDLPPHYQRQLHASAH